MDNTEITTIRQWEQAENSHKYSTYSDYKDSGEKWLGDIPQGWELTKLRFLINGKLKYGANESPQEYDPDKPRYIRITDINERGDLRPDTKKSLPEDLAEDYILQEGDILLARSGATVGKATLYQGVGENCACFAGYLIRVRLDDTILPKYFRYFSSTANYWSWINTFLIQSTIENVSAEKYKELQVPVPNKKEQKSIVRFLDEETANINNLIDKKEELVDLLEEKRTALIKKTVSNGINTQVETKESGVEWLGKIPKHWEVRDLRYLADIDTGGKDTKDAVEDGEYPFFVRSQTEEQIDTYSFDGEAVLTAGDGVGVGDVFHYIDGKFDYHQRVYKISDFIDEVDGRYVYYYLKANLKMEIFKSNAKSTVDSLRMPMFKSFPVAFGDVDEQQEIINHIESQSNRIDNLIKKVMQCIEHLKEYRTALITEAVTGQIDVRGEV